MSEMFCKMEDTKSVKKKVELIALNIKLQKALSLRDGGDYGALKIWKIN